MNLTLYEFVKIEYVIKKHCTLLTLISFTSICLALNLLFTYFKNSAKKLDKNGKVRYNTKFS